MEKIIRLPWHVPFGELSLKIDSLSLIFLAAIVILVTCAGIYGAGYMRRYAGKKPVFLHVISYAALAAALALVVTANNIILFLGAWELMSLATYFLIVFHDERPSARKAGLLYLIMTHCGTFCVILMFFLMARQAGSMDLDVISRTGFSPAAASAIFLLALMGFGVKSGFIPQHIWLPHAHPEAPSHVSALLSGVAIKTGIYGICRVIQVIEPLPDWCGYMLMTMGMVSGVMGVLYALGQHELKKLLAYHSIENIGIIALGLGLGLVGRGHGLAFVAVLGFAGGLLHVLNHSLFKGLLFLGAGAVIQKRHTGEMDRLGGLAKIMPVTSALFLVGALSICGLPLFNGFISEFIIYSGLFRGLISLPAFAAISCMAGILMLALMGALALACFAKVYGTVFLGEPREEIKTHEAPGREASRWMIMPMMVLAGLCVLIGMAPGIAVPHALRAAEGLANAGPSRIDMGNVLGPLNSVIGVSFVLITAILGLMLARRILLGSADMPVTETWRCGFAKASSRVQYTSSSFARSLVGSFKAVLLYRRRGGNPAGLFPATSEMSSSVRDISEEALVNRFFKGLTGLSRKIDDSRIRYTQMYLMYIFMFLIILLVWKLR